MEQTGISNNAELSKSDLKSPPVEESGTVDVDNGFSDSYIDPAKEREMMWKFDVCFRLMFIESRL